MSTVRNIFIEMVPLVQPNGGSAVLCILITNKLIPTINVLSIIFTFHHSSSSSSSPVALIPARYGLGSSYGLLNLSPRRLAMNLLHETPTMRATAKNPAADAM